MKVSREGGIDTKKIIKEKCICTVSVRFRFGDAALGQGYTCVKTMDIGFA